jgi:hypothetical protein
MFDVLPWSVAMPLVVKRLTCSIERMPSRTAEADVLGGHVVLEVDEGLGLVVIPVRRQLVAPTCRRPGRSAA